MRKFGKIWIFIALIVLGLEQQAIAVEFRCSHRLRRVPISALVEENATAKHLSEVYSLAGIRLSKKDRIRLLREAAKDPLLSARIQHLNLFLSNSYRPRSLHDHIRSYLVKLSRSKDETRRLKRKSLKAYQDWEIIYLEELLLRFLKVEGSLLLIVLKDKVEPIIGELDSIGATQRGNPFRGKKSPTLNLLIDNVETQIDTSEILQIRMQQIISSK